MGATAMYLAAESGQTEIVRFLCKQRADLNQPTSDVEQPPLLAAVLHNHGEIVELLCEARADLDQVRGDISQDTTLTLASEYGFLGTCRCLLEAKASANKPAGSGSAPLLLAAEHGHEGLVKVLCAAKADPNQTLTTCEGIAPLPVAARRGFLQIVEHLLQARADPNMKCFPTHLSEIMLATENANACLGHTLSTMPDMPLDSDVAPVLFVALLNHRIEVVSMLCRYKADPNRCANDHATPLLCATKAGVIHLVRILCEAHADINFAQAPHITPLHSAACEGQSDIVEYLCQKRADVNKEAHDGTFPLYSAVATDELDNSNTVRLLLQARAESNKCVSDVSAKCNAKDEAKAAKTPLIVAAEHHQVEAARLLLEARASVQAAAAKGTTALLMAAEVAIRRNLDMVELLLEHRSAVDQANLDYGATALHIAASCGHVPLAQQLLLHKAHVDSVTTKGHTPLHFACWWNHPETARLLLDARADKHARVCNRPGINAFLMTVLQDNPDVMKVLCGDQVHVQDPELCSVLMHVAARNGQAQIAGYLCQLRCDLNRVVRKEDILYLTLAAQSAQCLHPCNSAAIHADSEDESYRSEEEDDFEEDVLHAGDEVDAGYAAMNVREVDLQVGVTALHLAAFYGHDDLVYSLLSSRADPDFAGNSSNLTPLMAAAGEGFPDVVRVLGESRADLDRTDRHGRTALFIAAEEARTDVVAELCRARADVNKSPGQVTPLHMAVSGNCTEMVCVLCTAGAHIEEVRASLQQTLGDFVAPVVLILT